MRKSFEAIATITATGVLFAGCSSETHDTSAYEKARENAISTMNNVDPETLVDCSIESVAVSKVGDAPAIVVDYTLSDSKQASENKWLRDGGTSVDGKVVEVTWGQNLSIQHTLKDGTVLRGHTTEDTPATYGYAQNGEHEITIPLNTKFQGNRIVEPLIDLESMSVEDIHRQGNQTISASCGKVALSLSGETITLLDQ